MIIINLELSTMVPHQPQPHWTHHIEQALYDSAMQHNVWPLSESSFLVEWRHASQGSALSSQLSLSLAQCVV